MSVPKYDDLFNPLLKSLNQLGGSASVREMEEKVADILKLTDKEINEIHSGNRTLLSYRLAWARNYLKRYGLLENSSRGVWSLTPKGLGVKSVNKQLVNKTVKSLDIKNKNKKESLIEEDEVEGWKDELLSTVKSLSPAEFEKLCQRILREAGFVKVDVTGKSGDGGIDGTGVVRLNGFLSIHVYFQCKRYQGSVSSQEIREFKGAMVGRADKGLFITTGTFTRDAKQEAIREGSSPIDLVNGEDLIQKMKELNLGVEIKSEEIIMVKKDWFNNF